MIYFLKDKLKMKNLCVINLLKEQSYNQRNVANKWTHLLQLIDEMPSNRGNAITIISPIMQASGKEITSPLADNAIIISMRKISFTADEPRYHPRYHDR